MLSFESGLITYDQLPHPEDEGSYHMDHTPMRSICVSLSSVSLRHLSEKVAANGLPASEITAESIRINVVNERRAGSRPQIAQFPTSGDGSDANIPVSPGFYDAEEDANLGERMLGGGIRHGGRGSNIYESSSSQRKDESSANPSKNASFEAGVESVPGNGQSRAAGGGQGKKTAEKSLKEGIIGGIHLYQGILVQVRCEPRVVPTFPDC